MAVVDPSNEYDAFDAMDDLIPDLPGTGRVRMRESDPPRLHELVDMMRANPIFVEPVLDWVKAKAADIQLMTLVSLHGVEKTRGMLSEIFTEDQVSKAMEKLS